MIRISRQRRRQTVAVNMIQSSNQPAAADSTDNEDDGDLSMHSSDSHCMQRQYNNLYLIEVHFNFKCDCLCKNRPCLHLVVSREIDV